MKIFTIVGARPNFIKIDPDLPNQTIIHTGQHYDYKLSQVFFDDLAIPKPKYNLNCKGNEIGKMIDKLTKLLKKEKPNLVIVFGDTHSSLAGALAATYLNIPVAHIEAGLRSNNRLMPEEINRILIDKIARVRFCPTMYAEKNLISEGLIRDNYVVGDALFDTLLRFIPIQRSKEYRKYCLVTLHRNINVDNKDNLKSILEALAETNEKFVLPLHPRTKANLKLFKLKMPKNVKILKPLTYPRMLSMISNAKKVITDSGGVQREAFWMNIPLIILRTETEWIDIPAKQCGVLVGTNKEMIKEAINNFTGLVASPPEPKVNQRIRKILYKYV